MSHIIILIILFLFLLGNSIFTSAILKQNLVEKKIDFSISKYHFLFLMWGVSITIFAFFIIKSASPINLIPDNKAHIPSITINILQYLITLGFCFTYFYQLFFISDIQSFLSNNSSHFFCTNFQKNNDQSEIQTNTQQLQSSNIIKFRPKQKTNLIKVIFNIDKNKKIQKINFYWLLSSNIASILLCCLILQLIF